MRCIRLSAFAHSMIWPEQSYAGLGIPDALLDQLAIGGRLVAPVAKNEKEQQLVMVERMSSQRYQRTVLDEVFFVPLQSGIV